MVDCLCMTEKGNGVDQHPEHDTDTTRYTLRGVTPPLHPQEDADTKKEKSTPVRSINEDDDGYDPYSDYKEPTRFFEKDPWQ